jgi:hypothetical protein
MQRGLEGTPAANEVEKKMKIRNPREKIQSRKVI